MNIGVVDCICLDRVLIPILRDADRFHLGHTTATHRIFLFFFQEIFPMDIISLSQSIRSMWITPGLIIRIYIPLRH